jgi:hypothetical protein
MVILMVDLSLRNDENEKMISGASASVIQEGAERIPIIFSVSHQSV